MGWGWGKETALKALTHHQMTSGVWEILIHSRRAPQSLAGAADGDAKQHSSIQGGRRCFSRATGTVQALIAGSVLSHTRCLRSAGSPRPSLPVTLCCPTKICHQGVLLLCLPQPQSTEIALLKTTRHIICNSRVPSTKFTLGRFTLSKTNHPIRRVRPYKTSQCYSLSTG